MSAPSLRQPDLGREIWQVSPNSVDLESWGVRRVGGFNVNAALYSTCLCIL